MGCCIVKCLVCLVDFKFKIIMYFLLFEIEFVCKFLFIEIFGRYMYVNKVMCMCK